MKGDLDTDDRSQAFTLEGIVGTIIILTALLFALESVIITPTTGGSVDPSVRERLNTESEDILSSLAQNESFGLSEYARYWDQDTQTFYSALNPRVGYGTREPPGQLGKLMENTFTTRDRTYNIILRYRKKNASEGYGTVPMVYRGQPSESAVTSTYTVTLYDNQTLTAPGSPPVSLWRYDTNATDDDGGYYPIPNAVDGPVYNVVEFRVIAW